MPVLIFGSFFFNLFIFLKGGWGSFLSFSSYEGLLKLPFCKNVLEKMENVVH